MARRRSIFRVQPPHSLKLPRCNLSETFHPVWTEIIFCRNIFQDYTAMSNGNETPPAESNERTVKVSSFWWIGTTKHLFEHFCMHVNAGWKYLFEQFTNACGFLSGCKILLGNSFGDGIKRLLEYSVTIRGHVAFLCLYGTNNRDLIQ